MWHRLTSFLKLHLQSYISRHESNVHRIEFETLCLNKKITPEILSRFTDYKNDLLANSSTIKVKDFGAGSRVFNSDYRPVNKIAKVAGISDKKAKDLINTCIYYNPKSILEIGTSLGLGTFALHLGAPEAKIISLEGCPNTADIAGHQLEKHGAINVQIEVGNFDKTLKPILQANAFDLIYFDGNHSKEATLNYFEWAVENVTQKSIYIFDDIHWSKEMLDAWKKIQLHPKVASAITTYQWGILFFKIS